MINIFYLSYIIISKFIKYFIIRFYKIDRYTNFLLRFV
jgi:hypothetical protein